MTKTLPNIVWIVWDSCRADFTLSDYRGIELTPNLKKLAEDGVTFNNAFSAAPWTLPSHASMFTGLYPSKHSYLDDGMELYGQHIAEILASEGYNTISVTGLAKIGSHTPLSNGFETVYELFRLPRVGMDIRDIWKYYGQIFKEWAKFLPNYLANRQGGEYLETSLLKHYISKAPDSDPVFIFANYISPHSEYNAPEPYRSRFEGKYDDAREEIVEQLCIRGGYRYMADEISVNETEWQAVKDRYAGEIRYVDSQLGSLIQCMKSCDIYDQSIIIVTSDHGEHFGEHGRAYHQFSLYDEVINVPMVIEFLNNNYAGTEISNLVSSVDLFPTILDSVDLKVDQGNGESLTPINKISREAVFAEYGEPVTAIQALHNNTENQVSSDIIDELDTSLQCVRTEDHKLIQHTKGDYEAYDLSTKPKESRDLSESGSTPYETKNLINEIERNLSVLPPIPEESTDDREIRKNLKALGYR